MSSKTPRLEAQAEEQSLNFEDLEKQIDSMTLELHQAEKFTIQQAKKINSYDRALFDSESQLRLINDAVEQLKTNQQIVDEGLEFLANQLKILTQSLEPLQLQFDIKSEIDLERQQVYSIVENLNAQLKQTTENLKDIIEDLNKLGSEAEVESEPNTLAQSFKIIDTHINALERIEATMQKMEHKLEEIVELQANTTASFEFSSK